MRTTGRRQIQLQNSEHSGSATEQIDNFFDSDDAASNRSANEAENWNGEVNHQASRGRRRNDASKRRHSRRNAAKPKPNYVVDTLISDDDEELLGRQPTASKKESNVVNLLDHNSGQDEFIPASDDDGEAAYSTSFGKNQQSAVRVSNDTKNKTSASSRTSKGRRRRYGARSQQKH